MVVVGNSYGIHIKELFVMNTIFGKILVVLLVGLFFSMPVFAQDNQQVIDHKDSPIALDGYDVVSYFVLPAPELGSLSYQAGYEGKRYLFLNDENRKKFAADPEKYLPEFEEYCGCAASENKRIKADPAIFKITAGKLVLFEDKKALSKWNKNETVRYQDAQKFWSYESEYNANDRLQDDTRLRLFPF